MPAISNLNKAHRQINQQMMEHQGQLTTGVAKRFFDDAVADFNLSEEKVSELQAMSFDRDIDNGDVIEDTRTLEEIVIDQQVQIENLTLALSKIATLTGYGNHLKEFQIDKWEPTRKDMNKKYS